MHASFIHQGDITMNRLTGLALAWVTATSTAHAATVFESATGPFDAWACCVGASIGDKQFIGASFSISQATKVDAIGGHFNNFADHPDFGLGGTVFGALVKLGADGLPVGDLSHLEGVLAHRVFTPTSGVDSQVALDAILQPGQYGLVFGSGLFGADGRSSLTFVQPGEALTSAGDVLSLNDSSFPTWGWMEDKPNRFRVFVSGSLVSSVPEPQAWLMLAMGAAGVGLIRRRRSTGATQRLAA
jgi:hypothetical protein